MAKKAKTLQERIIIQLNERFCREVNVEFNRCSHTTIISKGCEKALNSYDNDKEEVYATPWFDDFLFFIRIQFFANEKKPVEPYVSVSFFQNVGSQLKQLFRAEWDSYPPKDGYSHPQPHWHFTAQLSDITSFSELDKEDEGISSKLAGNSKTIKLDKMHFAMAGNWLDNGDMISQITSENALIDWMIYLFRHVREELMFKGN